MSFTPAVSGISGANDVALSNPTGDNALVYDGSTAKWKNAPQTVAAANVSDASSVGRSIVTANSAAAVRATIGAGTSNLALGTTASTAKAGDWTPAIADLPAGVPYFVLRTSSTPNPARPNVPSGMVVAWVDTVSGLSQPSNWANNDLWIAAETTVEPNATLTFSATAEGNSDGATITTANSPFTFVDTGTGGNTQTYTTSNPVAGSVSYRISQASGGGFSNLGINNLTGQDQWAVTFLFNYETLPTQSGGSACLKAYNGNTWAGTDSTFTVFCTNAGNLFINSGLGAAQGKILETGAGIVNANTKYRLRLQGQVTSNKIRMILDTGTSSSVLYDSGLVTPSGTSHEVGQFTAIRWGAGSSGATAAITLKGELYLGTGPGLLTVG